MKKSALLLGLLLLLGAGAPRAQTPAANYLDQAAGAFAGLDFERALGLLERALQKKGNSPGELVRIYGLRAMCLISLGRSEAARHSFRAALSIDPGFRLTPDVSPRFQEPFRELLKAGVLQVSFRLEFPPQLDPDRPPRGTAELLSDPEGLAGGVVVYYRFGGQRAFSSTRVALQPGKPAPFQLGPALQGAGAAEFLEWYAELQDAHENRLLLRGDAEHPLQVPLRRREPELALPPPAPVEAPALAAPTPWWDKWWVWAIAGTVAAAAGGVTAGLLLSRPAPNQRDFNIEIH